jgi:hypothetical protein
MDPSSQIVDWKVSVLAGQSSSKSIRVISKIDAKGKFDLVTKAETERCCGGCWLWPLLDCWVSKAEVLVVVGCRPLLGQLLCGDV